MLRNADRVTDLGSYHAKNVASIQPFSQLQRLVLTLESERTEVALFPCSLIKLLITLCNVRMHWKMFPPLCCLQELDLRARYQTPGLRVQLDDSFAVALPLFRVFRVCDRRYTDLGVALETRAKVVMPHLVELTIYQFDTVHLDLRFMSALKSLTLLDCTVSTVSAACSTMVMFTC